MTITFDYGVRPIELNISNQNLYIELYKDGNRMDAKIGSEKYLDGDGVLQTRTILPSIPADSLVSVFSDEFETNSAGKIIAVGSNARYLKIIINTPSITGTVREYDEKTISLQSARKTTRLQTIILWIKTIPLLKPA